MDSSAPDAPAASHHTPYRYLLWMALIASAAWLWQGTVAGTPRTVLIYIYWAYAALLWFTVFCGYNVVRSNRSPPEALEAMRQTQRDGRPSRLIRYGLQAIFIGVLFFGLSQPLLAGVYLAAVLAMVALRANPKSRRAANPAGASG